jgi:hypothetical protein
MVQFCCAYTTYEEGMSALKIQALRNTQNNEYNVQKTVKV